MRAVFGVPHGINSNSNVTPDPHESGIWGTRVKHNGIRGTPVKHNRDAEWLDGVKAVINVKMQLKKDSSLKGSGSNGVHGYWPKYFRPLHSRIAEHLDKILETSLIPEWMNLGRTILCVKDVILGSLVENFRPK